MTKVRVMTCPQVDSPLTSEIKERLGILSFRFKTWIKKTVKMTLHANLFLTGVTRHQILPQWGANRPWGHRHEARPANLLMAQLRQRTPSVSRPPAKKKEKKATTLKAICKIKGVNNMGLFVYSSLRKKKPFKTIRQVLRVLRQDLTIYGKLLRGV